MTHARRSAAVILLLLLAVTFGPLLCRIGGDQAWKAVQATAAGVLADTGTADAATAGPATAAGPTGPEAGHRADRFAVWTDVLDVPKRCSGQHAPGSGESAPLPAPHRGEPLAPGIAGPAPMAVDLPAQFALARPPTAAGHADHSTLLPVLRI
ncbi:hypothetical protein [Streptomyces sp. NPDC048644]|uniref:hypothetical protein n=1 Tax=Streptomyces sp. NPDC048644 TaxID=3365582 RepID=UPI0037200225